MQTQLTNLNVTATDAEIAQCAATCDAVLQSYGNFGDSVDTLNYHKVLVTRLNMIAHDVRGELY